MAYGAGPNNSGPNKRMNGPDGRVRNTQTSNASRTPGVPRNPQRPSVPGLGTSFSSAAGVTGQLAGAWASFQNIIAASEAKRKNLKAGFKTERAGIRQEAIGLMSDAINQGIESGMTGSSQVSQARIGVLGQRRADIEAAKIGMEQAVLDTKVADQQAYMDLQITQAQVDMQAEAMRQQAALAQQALDAQNANTQALIDAYGNATAATTRLAETTPGGLKIHWMPDGTKRVAGVSFGMNATLEQIDKAIAQIRANKTFIGNRVAAGRM